MEKELLQVLVKQLNLTNVDDEPEKYILTPDEEDSVIEHEIDRQKKHKAWRLAERALSEQEILLRLSQVNWEEEIDKVEILQRANSSKHYNIWQSEQRLKDAKNKKTLQEAIEKRCNAKYMYNVLAWTSENEYGKKLIVHEDNKFLIKVLCFFLSNDPRFETELELSFKKGLLIRGISGLGKTHLVQCLAANELNPILIYSMIGITDEIKSEGEYSIVMQDRKIIYLDDVGTEEAVVNHFGTKVSFFKNFIETVYLRNKTYNKLIISTNNSFKEIEEKYGFRVRSRMQEMFNVINVTGKDMRI